MSSSCSDVCISTYTYSPLHPCFYSNIESCKMLYHIESCRMMVPISYLVYNVNYLVCLLITKAIRLENITMYVSLGFTVYNNHSCPWVPPWSQVLIEHQWDCKIGNYYIALSLQQEKFVSLLKIWCKTFSMLLGDTVAKVCTSPRNST